MDDRLRALVSEHGELTVDNLRRRLRTTKAAVVAAAERLGLMLDPERETVRLPGEEDEPMPLTTASSSPPGVRPEYKALYAEYGGHCGDELARLLSIYLNVGVGRQRRIDDERIAEVARENGLFFPKGSNPGFRRMNLGNALRRKLNGGTPVTVNGAVLKPRGSL